MLSGAFTGLMSSNLKIIGEFLKAYKYEIIISPVTAGFCGA